MKVVITGAAGTIGSALVRHYVDAGDMVYAIDTAENGLYMMGRDYPVITILQDIGQPEFWKHFYGKNTVDLVINCAAQKQLPMVEQHPFYAYKTNAQAVKAVCTGPKVIHISTDKAVYPLSLYGFTKYIGEEYAKAAGARVIRLVNVYASSGSVVEVFSKQIDAGGPVTITDPHMSRFFVHLDQAVDIIVNSQGDFVMPAEYETINIWELAHRMIGDRRVNVQVTGARPGEKIVEDLFYRDEKFEKEGKFYLVDSPKRILNWELFEDDADKAIRFSKYNFMKFMWYALPAKE
jgi:FlaA1/EpsC-like NDP-sugar epimerase